ncbi:hypothetical protein [Magnetospirillum sp. UT-4]|uniref:hypothetical protein n=1 Tax=Magnetospirillum sp. UT-4 TaxID=2681467 RepID=UPI0015731900|nr:hypothetical protein [Magnetospirillum sp. UT-4]
MEIVGGIARTLSAKKMNMLERHWDRYTSAEVNLFLRPPFRNAVAQAIEKDAALVVYDLFKMLGLIADQDKAMACLRDLCALPIKVYDGKLIQCLQDMSEDRRTGLLINALASKRGRKFGKPQAIPDRNPTQRALQAAERVRQRHSDDSARRTESLIDAILFEVGRDVGNAEIAKRLNDQGYKTARGGMWKAISVQRVRERARRLAVATITETPQAASG